MNTLEYKNQIGSVDTSIEDMCLHGELLFIEDTITYEATTVAKLKTEFEAAVDDYLANCERLGRDPQRPYKGSFNVRIGAELHKQLAIQAKRKGKSINEYVKKAIQKQIGIRSRN